uniref:Uncharacterized protein n=1 Tax=Zea mays TaxID=4577 RepID=A0A804PVB7_MAIZE
MQGRSVTAPATLAPKTQNHHWPCSFPMPTLLTASPSSPHASSKEARTSYLSWWPPLLSSPVPGGRRPLLQQQAAPFPCRRCQPPGFQTVRAGVLMVGSPLQASPWSWHLASHPFPMLGRHRLPYQQATLPTSLSCVEIHGRDILRRLR